MADELNPEPLALECLRALEQMFEEWESEEDDRAYRDL